MGLGLVGLGLDSLAERHGIQDFSPLFDLLYDFDVVWDISLDRFHLLFEGNTKKMMRRMFTGGKARFPGLFTGFSPAPTKAQKSSRKPQSGQGHW